MTLVDHLKIALASSYCFVIKAQHFHWNVEGKDFPQHHRFFDEIASEVYDNAIDKTAEYIRALDAYTPSSLTRYQELSIIADQVKVPRAELMMLELHKDNQLLIDLWKQMFSLAEQESEQGIANFIAERIDAHGKWGWQLRSIMKVDRA